MTPHLPRKESLAQGHPAGEGGGEHHAQKQGPRGPARGPGAQPDPRQTQRGAGGGCEATARLSERWGQR